VCLPSGGARPMAHTSPITRTADPSSGRLSQVSAGGFPLIRAIAVAYSANWGAQLWTISSTLPSLLPASLWSMTIRPSAVRMRRSILPTTRWLLSSLAEMGYSAQSSLPDHLEENHENRSLPKCGGPPCRKKAEKPVGKKVRYGPSVVEDPWV